MDGYLNYGLASNMYVSKQPGWGGSNVWCRLVKREVGQNGQKFNGTIFVNSN